MEQLLAHLVGDYILQSDWMAKNKTKSFLAAFTHAVTYTYLFIFITQSWGALSIICTTHFVIDYWRLARYVCWIKNGRKESITHTGYPSDNPEWLSTWLMIIADNTMHMLINYFAIKYF